MNIMYYAILTCLIAKLTGYESGVFNHQIVDAHIYKDHIEQCKELISREPFDSPQIKINDRLKGRGLEGLLDLKVSDIEITNYKHHPPLKGKMSV
jgi:thymidylate synthase